MNNYKDFIVKTIIVTFAVLLVIFYLLSPINKSLRVADQLITKLDRLERKIGDKTLKGYIIDKLYHESKSDRMEEEDQQKLINSINKIIQRDLKPIIEGIKY